MGELFDVESHTVTYHLQEIYKTEELEESATTRKIRAVRKEGNRNVEREIQYYNLDAIIAVGYRVNSKKAKRFRQWATKTLEEYIQKGFVLNDEMLKNGNPHGRDYFDELLERTSLYVSALTLTRLSCGSQEPIWLEAKLLSEGDNHQKVLE